MCGDSDSGECVVIVTGWGCGDSDSGECVVIVTVVSVW